MNPLLWLLLIFGVPATVVALFMLAERRSRRIHLELKLGEWPVSQPATEDAMRLCDGTTVTQRHEVDDALLAADKARDYGIR